MTPARILTKFLEISALGAARGSRCMHVPSRQGCLLPCFIRHGRSFPLPAAPVPSPSSPSPGLRGHRAMRALCVRARASTRGYCCHRRQYSAEIGFRSAPVHWLSRYFWAHWWICSFSSVAPPRRRTGRARERRCPRVTSNVSAPSCAPRGRDTAASCTSDHVEPHVVKVLPDHERERGDAPEDGQERHNVQQGLEDTAASAGPAGDEEGVRAVAGVRRSASARV